MMEFILISMVVQWRRMWINIRNHVIFVLLPLLHLHMVVTALPGAGPVGHIPYYLDRQGHLVLSMEGMRIALKL